jgi:hypothetical protein
MRPQTFSSMPTAILTLYMNITLMKQRIFYFLRSINIEASLVSGLQKYAFLVHGT